MKKLSTLLTAFAAMAGWVTACYWRERADWSSPADVEQMFGDAVTDVLNEPEHECGLGSYASVHITRAAEPPVPAFPWYAVMASTRFEVDEETGLREIHTQDGWFPSKDAAHKAVIGWSTPSVRVDDEPDF